MWLSVMRGVEIVNCADIISARFLPPRSPAMVSVLSSETHRRFDEAQLLRSLSFSSDFFCRTFFAEWKSVCLEVETFLLAK